MYFDAVNGLFYIDTAGAGSTTGARMAVNSWGAKKAYADEDENRITSTYLKDINVNNFDVILTKGNSTTSSFTLPGVQNITSSSNNGAISVNIGGTATDVTITGLNDLAYIATATTNSSSTYLRGDGTWAAVDITPIEVIKLI